MRRITKHMFPLRPHPLRPHSPAFMKHESDIIYNLDGGGGGVGGVVVFEI